MKSIYDCMREVNSCYILIPLLIGNVFFRMDFRTALLVLAFDLCAYVVAFLFMAMGKYASDRLSEIVATWE